MASDAAAQKAAAVEAGATAPALAETPNSDASRVAATEAFQVNTDPEHKVSLKLSNPLRAVYAVRVGLQDKDYDTNATVRVTRPSARAIIGAGYAQVDPEDAEAVAVALELAPPTS